MSQMHLIEYGPFQWLEQSDSSLIMMHKLKIVEEITHKEMSSSVGRQTHTMLEVMRFGRKE